MGNSASALPFTIRDELYPSTRTGSYGFSIHSGERKSDLAPVTVFKGSKSLMAKTTLIKGSVDPTLMQIFPALHHFKKCKTLVHPRILSVHATLDTDNPDGNNPANASSNAAGGGGGDGSINPASLSALEQTATTGDLIIVTEPVVPLADYLETLENDPELSNAQRADAIAWGIYNLIQAANFLHNTAKVAHGNLSMHCIFVTPAGDFKLSAFHLLTPVGIGAGSSGPTQHFRHFERDITPKEYRSSERIESRFDAISTCPVHAMDAYSFGVLLPAIYEHYGAGTNGRLPQKLEKACQRLRTNNISARPRILPLSKCPIFETSKHVQAQRFLEDIATQSTDSKIAFWKSLPDLVSRKVLSPRIAKYKILPLLQQTITNLTAVDANMTQEISKVECQAFLPILFHTATSHLTPKEFQAQLSSVIEMLFKVNDRGVRVAMLSYIPLFAENLDGTTLNRIVFEPMCSGFTDSSGPLRAATLKSAIVLVTHLSQPNLEKLTRYLVRLQSDPEDSVRTNSVIFIGKVAPNLTDIARSKLILPAFMRAMRDDSVLCRLAGLKAICACRSLFEEKKLAQEVLPAISGSLVDDSEEVRTAAMNAVEELLAILRELGERMSVEERKRASDQPLSSSHKNNNGSMNRTASGSSYSSAANGSTYGGKVATSAANTAAVKSSSSSYLSGLSSWATSKITTSAQATGGEGTVTAAANKVDHTNPMASSTGSESGFGSFPTSTASASAVATTAKMSSKPKPAPQFSSLGLRDAGVGGVGSSSGWSDEEFDDDTNGGNKQGQDSLIPSFASNFDNDGDDFMSQFDKKSAIRPRAAGNTANLKTPNRIAAGARRREELKKKEKPAVKKLLMDDDAIGDGWDDF